MATATQSNATPSSPRPVWQNWAEVLRTQNLSSDQKMDGVSRWLLIIRASVFPMTLTSGLLGGLFAVAGPTPAEANWSFFALALFGLVLAHAANNMINDYFDLAGGVDSASYVRGQYAPHPILNGLISKGGLIAAIAAIVAYNFFVTKVDNFTYMVDEASYSVVQTLFVHEK